MKAKQRIILSALVLVSALLCWYSASLQAGYAETPYGTKDSKGQALGFNAPVTWELCIIMLRNATLPTTTKVLGWYGGLFLFAHLLALIAFAINMAAKAKSLVAAAFWLQLILFPTGWIGLLFLLPLVAFNFFAGGIDGEMISEIPCWWTFKPSWLVVSAATGILIQRQALSPKINEAGNFVSQSSASPRLGGS